IGLAQILPDVFLGVEFRAAGQKKERRQIVWPFEFLGFMPAGVIEKHNAMSAKGYALGDFIEMLLHRERIGVGQHQRRARIALGTDGAEHIDAFIALICGLARARAALGPLAHAAILLAKPHFVLEPNLNPHTSGQAAQDCIELGLEVFLKASIAPSAWSGCRGRALICEKPNSRSTRPMVSSSTVTPNRSLAMHTRSIRRQRTTPSF